MKSYREKATEGERYKALERLRFKNMQAMSAHDGYPLLFGFYEAIEILEDLLSGADEDRERDTRISEVLRLLKHLQRVELTRAHRRHNRS